MHQVARTLQRIFIRCHSQENCNFLTTHNFPPDGLPNENAYWLNINSFLQRPQKPQQKNTATCSLNPEFPKNGPEKPVRIKAEAVPRTCHESPAPNDARPAKTVEIVVNNQYNLFFRFVINESTFALFYPINLCSSSTTTRYRQLLVEARIHVIPKLVHPSTASLRSK